MNKKFAVYETEFGYFNIESIDDYITKLEKVDEPLSGNGIRSYLTDKVYEQLLQYLNGDRKEFDFKYKLYGTDFQKKVWNELLKIPYVETKTYKNISINVGNPLACRAVGLANNKNPIAIVVPCHRVIGSNGKLVGYAYGIEMKKYLLNLEKKYK